MNLLEVTSDFFDKSIIKELGFGETLLFGGQMLLLGMMAVFSVLCSIWLLLTVFKKVFTNINSKPASAPKSEEAVPIPAPVVNTADGEIVAAIAAAIAMAESENNGLKFRVVSFRKK